MTLFLFNFRTNCKYKLSCAYLIVLCSQHTIYIYWPVLSNPWLVESSRYRGMTVKSIGGGSTNSPKPMLFKVNRNYMWNATLLQWNKLRAGHRFVCFFCLCVYIYLHMCVYKHIYIYAIYAYACISIYGTHTYIEREKGLATWKHKENFKLQMPIMYLPIVHITVD